MRSLPRESLSHVEKSRGKPVPSLTTLFYILKICRCSGHIAVSFSGMQRVSSSLLERIFSVSLLVFFVVGSGLELERIFELGVGEKRV